MSGLMVGAVHLANDAPPGPERVRLAASLIGAAAGDGCRLAVLPELAWSNLAVLQHRGITAADEAVYREALATLGGTARSTGCAVVAPMILPAPPGGHGNGAVVLDEFGEVAGTARKHRLPAGPGLDETAVFAPGQDWCVASLHAAQVGVLVCADRRDPDHWRALASMGASVVAVLVAGSGGDAAGMVLAELRTYSRLAGVGAVFACRAGTDTADGAEAVHHAASCVVGADGTVLAGPLTSEASGVAMAALARVGSSVGD
ncbi:MAG: carbon-nitrogen hydrolase family protein, partial [Actinomycetota bacterium]|nr:carbon-nitrogen hydrolase family protein [Actinomycetota bacterium]